MKSITVSLFLTLTIGLNLFAKSQVERVEPPFWWVGMKNTGLQIMIYGENISELKPEINYPGIQLERTVTVESPNYLFLYLKIDKSTQPGTFAINFTRKEKTVLTHEYTLKARREGSVGREGYSASDVIYLITPDRFANGNPANDNMPGMKEKANRNDKNGRHGGDLEGIIEHLDYIDSMGFTTLWINPLMENNMTNTSYHGYAITDFYNTDARYGTNNDYLRLVEEAKKRGMKVIIDMIMNHCGSEHWWMDDLPASDWLNFQDGWKQTSHMREANMDPYASNYDKKMLSGGWFVESMPDLNQRNPLLADYLIYNTIWWIENADLSGIRMDTYPYPDKYFMSEWTKRIMEEYPDFNMVGEEWSLNPAVVSYWQHGKKNKDGYVSWLPGVFDFPLQNALVQSLNENDREWGNGLVKLYALLANDYLYADPTQLVIFPDNHDMDRFYTQVNEDFDLFKMGMAYVAVTRGIPQIFYGTEILMANPDSHDHGEIRADFPGGWQGDSINAFAGKGLSKEQKEAQQYVKKLLNWRKGSKEVHEGKLKHFAPAYNSGIYTVFRYTDDKAVMLIMNKNKSLREVNLSPFKEEVLGEAASGTNVISGEEVSLAGPTVTVPARSALLLEISL